MHTAKDKQEDELSVESSSEAQPAEKFSKLVTPVQELRALIIQNVWERCQNRCSNCGFPDSAKLKLVFVVPERAGGLFIASNLTLLCRACEMATEALDRNPPVSRDSAGSRLVNFYMSRQLYDRIDRGILVHQGFDSKGALFRYLMVKFNENPDRFRDMDMWQDSGDNKIKISIWCDHAIYEVFKEKVFALQKTVTDALISLVMLYEAEAEPQLGKRTPNG